MTEVLLDTNAFSWSLQGTGGLTVPAQQAIANAPTVYLSPISIFQITQKVRIGKWPAMAPLAPNLAALAYLQRVTIVAVDAALCASAGSMVWSHRDPFDRIIAATAMHLNCPVVTSDNVFDGVTRIW